ncbi:MAG: serine acetyltransferase [Bacteroidales bacterium]|nr:serine acetyltransferase [Bacteroidales bacterium]
MYNNIISEVSNKLTSNETFNKKIMCSIFKPLPDNEVIKEIIKLLFQVLYPGYFFDLPKTITIKTNVEYILERLYGLIIDQIHRCLCLSCKYDNKVCNQNVNDIVESFLKKLPTIQERLATDVIAIYNGDPAAKSYDEVILCYPGLKAITCYRIAHELYNLNVPLLPRIITEIAHSETGIDIHPGAKIGEYFAIDHGTGIVIGETTEIGNNVKIYQGVTLGAKSFPLDENGNPIKGIPRHPIVEDNVIIYAEATILGRIRIGHHSIIGANQWITSDVPPYTKITSI